MRWLLNLYLKYCLSKKKYHGRLKRICNIKPDIIDARDFKITSISMEESEIFSLQQYLPPEFNQGSIGSCWSNAKIGMALLMYKKSNPRKYQDIMQYFNGFSRLADYYWSRDLDETISTDTDEDTGQSMREGCKIIHKIGLAPEKLWVYDTRNYQIVPPQLAKVFAYLYKSPVYYRVYSLKEAMKILATQEKPIGIGIWVDKNFINKGAGLIEDINIDEAQFMRTGHAMYIYKKDDIKEQATLRNSWGLGDDVIMPYSVLQKAWIDAWTFDIKN